MLIQSTRFPTYLEDITDIEYIVILMFLSN